MALKVVVCVVAMSQLLLLMLTVMNNFHFRSSTCAAGHPTDPPHHQTFQAAASTTPFTSTKEASRSNRDSNTISNRPEIPIVLGIDGGTESIRAAFFNAYTGHPVGQSYSCAYKTYRPNPGWAEQHPDEWYASLCVAVRGALASIEGEIPENEGAAAGTGGLDGDSNHDVVDDNIVGGGREDNNKQKYILKSLCIDTTCCSVVALSSTHTPLRPSLLWMDARSAKEAKLIMEVVAREVADITSKSESGNEEEKEDHYGSDVSPYASSTNILLSHFPELRINSAGHGPISAEFLLPKSMWIKQNEPQLWDKAAVICEYQDYINYRLTGRMVASGCTAAVRWHHDGWEVVQKSKGGTDGSGRDADGDGRGGGGERNRKDEHRGRPMRLYKALNMEDLASKLPQTTLAMGDIVGGLTSDAARDLGLPVGTKVVQGGPDAFVGMIGLGTVKPGQTCLITGSSHLHCMVTSNPGSSSPGTWGAYRGAPLPHLNFIEGGQSSTGCLIRWVRDLTCPGGGSYKTLDEEASAIPPGCDGLVALETWQGSRTPHTDPLARGALLGLTLSHTRAHIYRSLLEAVCYGTRSCLDALEEAATSSSSTESNEVVIAGGATRSDLWLQLHADITGRTFVLNENADGPLLGCAILASVGAGIYSSVEEAVQNMVRRERRIAPRTDTKKVYNRLYEEVYMKVRPSVTNVFHALANLRGGGDSGSMRHGSMSDIEWSKVGRNRVNAEDKSLHGCLDNCIEQCSIRGGGSAKRTPIISPSLLASDW
jgi:ribulose kinase